MPSFTKVIYPQQGWVSYVGRQNILSHIQYSSYPTLIANNVLSNWICKALFIGQIQCQGCWNRIYQLFLFGCPFSHFSLCSLCPSVHPPVTFCWSVCMFCVCFSVGPSVHLCDCLSVRLWPVASEKCIQANTAHRSILRESAKHTNAYSIFIIPTLIPVCYMLYVNAYLEVSILVQHTVTNICIIVYCM